MVPTLSERLRRRAYECYSPHHSRVPWQVSPELPIALLCLAEARASAEAAAQVSAAAPSWASAEAAVQVSPEALAKSVALAQVSQPLAQANQPLVQANQPRLQPIGTEPNAGQSSSQELVLLLVLSLLTLLDGAKALRNLLISTASVWRPSQRFSAALPTHSAALAAKRVIHQPRLSGRFLAGAEWIQQRLIVHLFSPALLSRRR